MHRVSRELRGSGIAQPRTLNSILPVAVILLALTGPAGGDFPSTVRDRIALAVLVIDPLVVALTSDDHQWVALFHLIWNQEGAKGEGLTASWVRR